MHHYKELLIRSLFAGSIGYFTANKIYGTKQAKIDPELARNPALAEAVEDKDSLQYAEYAKKRHMKSELDFIRPGKI